MREDDNQLLERARHGEVDAYGEVVRRHQDRALAAAFVILGDRQEAEDATQEAFTNAYLALGRFRPGASFRAWLLRIVINEARDLLAARQRRLDALSRIAGGVGAVTATQSAEAAALSNRRREALLMALFDLPETDRLVVTCRYFLDFSETEIADILGVARGTVKSRLSRALARLGPILHDLGPLVVVPPVLDLSHLVAEHVGTGGRIAPTSLLAKLRSGARHVATFTAAGIATVLVASAVMVSRGRGAPAAPPAPPTSIVVMGADLSDSERQEMRTAFGNSNTSETISREELAAALGTQGVALQPSDAAISSVQLACGTPGSGLTVETRNIGRLVPAEYASAMLIAGLYEGSVIVAAPSHKTVSGETALVGLMKALPTCVGRPADEQRVALAYQNLMLVSAIAGSDEHVRAASAAFLDILNATLSGQAQDVAALNTAIDTATTARGLTIDDTTRANAVAYFAELRRLDYGPYSHGLLVHQAETNDQVRIAPAR